MPSTTEDLPPSPLVVMLIGLPGSGKSTLAKELVEKHGAVVCSTDDFFMRNGVYRFEPGRLRENHALNFQKFALAMAEEAPVVVVDNTNLLAEHRKPYVKLAKAMGYGVLFKVVGEFSDEACKLYTERNAHGVPLKSIERMAACYETPDVQNGVDPAEFFTWTWDGYIPAERTMIVQNLRMNARRLQRGRNLGLDELGVLDDVGPATMLAIADAIEQRKI